MIDLNIFSGEDFPISLFRLACQCRGIEVRGGRWITEQDARVLDTVTLGELRALLEELHEMKVVDDRETELAEALDAYTNPNHPDYDPEFDRKIRALRPDWFGGDKSNK